MADDIDKIARALQEAILESYSEKFKQKFFYCEEKKERYK
jgi:hypothetical protein